MNPDDPIRVFMIEDNDDDAELIRRFLTVGQSRQIEVEVSDRLSSALERLRGEKYDIILSDLGLPDGWGLDTFVKVHSEFPAIPIIILTGSDDEAGALEAMRRGAQDYLVKNQITGTSLVRVIRYAIERQKLLARLEKSLKEIKTLRKLLPICAWCKNIRNDQGYWNNIETYIKETGIEFTHGICPACSEKLNGQDPLLKKKITKDG